MSSIDGGPAVVLECVHPEVVFFYHLDFFFRQVNEANEDEMS